MVDFFFGNKSRVKETWGKSVEEIVKEPVWFHDATEWR